MIESKELLEFLQGAVPPDTPLTVSSEVKILEALGVVSNEAAISAMKVATLLVPADTPTTFRGLMSMLAQLAEMNPKATSKHRSAIAGARAQAQQVDDFPLTFGTFLPICQRLLEEKGKRGRRDRE